MSAARAVSPGVAAALAIALVLGVAGAARADAGPARADAGTGPARADAGARAGAPRLEPPPPPPEDPAKVVDRILREKRHGFCHDPDRKVGRDRHLCDYARDHAPACAAFLAACSAVAAPGDDEERGLSVPLWLAHLARTAFWVLLGVAVGYWLLRISRHFLEGRTLDEPATDFRASLAPESGRPARERPAVDRDAARLLASAEQALVRGDGDGAVRLAHSALLRALEAAGHVHVDRASSNGDYARALRDQPELRDLFREAARQLERSEFGKEPPRADLVRGLLARITPVVHRAGVALLVLLVAGGCSGWESLAESTEDTPRGTSVLAALLESRGSTLERRYRPLSELSLEATDTLVVSSSAPLSPDDWDTITGWTSDGGYLVLAGPHRGWPPQLGAGRLGHAPCATSPVVTLEGLSSARVTRAVPPLKVDSTWQATVACGDAPLVAHRTFGEGHVVAIADPDFLTNASLVSGDHARILLAVLGTPAAVSLVDHRLAAGAASPYRAVAASGLLPILAQGLVALILWVLATGTSFGTPRDPKEPGRRAFAEHVRAVGRLYARAGASRHALGAYAAWAIERLSARLRPGGGVRVLDLGSAIARVTGRKEAAVAALLAEAADARDRPGEPGTREDLVLIAQLDDIVHETGGYK